MLGAGFLFGAVLTIALGRILLNRAGAAPGRDVFGAAEAIAYLFTILFAAGVSLMAARVLEEASLASLAQMAAALTVAGAASVAAWIALARLSRRGGGALAGMSAEPQAPGRGRPTRPTGPSGAGARRTKAKRAA